VKVVYVVQSICCFCLRHTLNVIYFLISNPGTGINTVHPLIAHTSHPALEDGTDTGFRNVGLPKFDAGEIPKRTHATMITLAELWKYEVYMHNYDRWPGMALWSDTYIKHTSVSLYFSDRASWYQSICYNQLDAHMFYFII
jgi:hypothetical protein